MAESNCRLALPKRECCRNTYPLSAAPPGFEPGPTHLERVMLVRYTTELFPMRNAECGMRNQERTFKRLSFIPHSTFHIPHSSLDRPGVEPGSPARQAGVVPLDHQ